MNSGEPVRTGSGSRPKVFFTGGDGLGWALDEDLALTRRALGDRIVESDLDECDVVHCAWWEGLLALPRHKLTGKRIICHVSGEPFRHMALPQHRHAVEIVGRFVVRSGQALREFTAMGIPCDLIPHTVNAETFHPLPAEDPRLEVLAKEWAIPRDRYLIGNFNRDSEGGDLRRPKLVKGPDLFVTIVSLLAKRGLPIHVLLAGPRRHWVRAQLAACGVPFSQIGSISEADDLRINILPRETLNCLYNLLDLYIVSSRSEGGPQAVLEAGASRCKIVSTPVGLAEDILAPECIYAACDEAVARIESDMREGLLNASRDLHRERVLARHTPGAVASAFQHLYERLDGISPCPSPPPRFHIVPPPHPLRRALARLGIVSRQPRLTVSIWHKYFSPPYGGGNQFMIALRRALVRRGVKVRLNSFSRGIDAHLLNSVHFDIDRFRARQRQQRLAIVHRIDGPIHLVRGHDREKDELCFDLNRQLAHATAVQSAWTLQRIREMDYQPRGAVIIHNAVDPEIFHTRGRAPFNPRAKVRLIATSWSDNPRKGGATYRWLEDHLDWDRFEFTFVGRVAEPLQRAKHIQPVPSEKLAEILRAHHIYITASRNDPCSNALIEALACGLPALYLNEGGHPELVGFGGLPFSQPEEILPQLDRLVENFEAFQSLIVVPHLDEVADKYLALLRDAAAAR